ncbi:serine/threonine-protein phosphatase [Georgenia wutianyii]|uniref:Serine/threonine-protein phosphatase n=1 Tax=Georgenia wutianyii TaxID=2585135 RepID=A0ABX5VTW8_9MICO|nr:PP2C family protein-serine/threonine phosphatase [Georgenia wutianyii]QDB80525.1 serine/threonine-protein phosphatase [Georgenia wutianyii]
METPTGAAAEQALACLGTLLEGAHHATPDELADVVALAGRLQGWDLTVFLVTFDQRSLVPLGPVGDPLPVEGPEAAAFRDLRPVEVDGTAWLPLVDGSERVGTLRVVPLPDFEDAADRATVLRWVAMLVGHLVAVMTPHGDALSRARGARDRTVEAELLWNLLPPLTFAAHDVAVAGLLEPSGQVAGDAFDYAVEGSTVDVAIFDGTGHDLGSGLLTSVVLATYRNHRRRGDDLVACAGAVDRVLSTHTDGAGYATGVLLRLDTSTGELQYLNAGHPHPLLLRHGSALDPLTRSGRALFGLGGREASVSRVQLEPGDQVVLYTDGVTEARDEHGEFFGVDRLAALVRKHGADQRPAAETLRLIVRDIVDHQHGALQDDATVVLLSWAPRPSVSVLPA